MPDAENNMIYNLPIVPSACIFLPKTLLRQSIAMGSIKRKWSQS
jgi:hypothetical protein